jgi:hypothetical protein
MALFDFSKKKILFRGFNRHVTALDMPPVPASSQIPEWYKKVPKYVANTDKPIKALGKKDLKLCVPFRDAMINGYIIRLPADLEVAQSATGDIDIFNNQELPVNICHKRGNINDPMAQGHGMPAPMGTNPTMFSWMPMYGVELPKGFSALVTHPFNRYELPFITTTGLVDSDMFTLAGNIPFFVKKGFVGIIPAGTPIAQIIPIARHDWFSEIQEQDPFEYERLITKRDVHLVGSYGRHLRQPKSFK